jgi:hypothetical protein
MSFAKGSPDRRAYEQYLKEKTAEAKPEETTAVENDPDFEGEEIQPNK